MDRNDRDHVPCARLLKESPGPIVVPAPVVIELDWLTSSRLGPAAIDAFLAEVEQGMVRIVELTRDDYRRARELCSTYADLQLGFVDAAVLAVVERLGERKLATLDHRHFMAIRPKHVPALELLPPIG